VTVVAFDTLRFAQRLEAGGVPPSQAAATAAAFAEATGDVIATKIDMGDLRRDFAAGHAEQRADAAGLRAALAAVRQELKTDVASVRQELEALRQELTADVASVRQELKADIASVRQELEAARQELKADNAVLRRDMKALELRMTIKLGSMLAGAAVIFATLNRLL
jgi:chromosome segregation ATPase